MSVMAKHLGYIGVTTFMLYYNLEKKNAITRPETHIYCHYRLL